MKVQTIKLQEILSKAIRGCGNNKMIPITSLIAVELKDETLTVHTTDATNYMYVFGEDVSGEDFYVTVEADRFAKLISKFTCEYTELVLAENTLVVKGNGTYKIELPLDENGSLIKFPDPIGDLDLTKADTHSIMTADVKRVVASNKASLSTDVDELCYTAYYVDDKSVVTTDSYVVCNSDVSLMNDAVLISSDAMDLLTTVSDDSIEVSTTDNAIVFVSDDVTVYTVPVEGIDDYQIDAIRGLFDDDFDSSCKLVKSELLNVLDRLSLFVGTYDKNSVTLTFSNSELSISSKQSTGVDSISYNESSNAKPFTCDFDITMLQTQVKTNSGDFITIHYGNDSAIKITDGNVTHIVASIEEE